MEDICRWFDPISAGSWPDWIAAVFTSLAFTVAALSYARSVKVRREAQARLVYSSVTHVSFHAPGAVFDMLPNGAQIGKLAGGAIILGPSSLSPARHQAVDPVIQVTAVMHNRSKELIGPVKLQLVDIGHKQLQAFSMLIDVVKPESDYIVDFVFVNEHHPAQPSIGTTALFRDSSGTWWRRHLAQPVHRVHDDPENVRPTPSERAQLAQNAITLGIEPAADPRVPLKVWGYRAVRKLRGQPPFP